MFSIMGGRKSNGRLVPGAPSRTFTLMGSQTLDLTEVEAQEVDIRAFTMMGETKIIVPPGATVEMTGFILMGETSSKVKQGPHVRASSAIVRRRGRWTASRCHPR